MAQDPQKELQKLRASVGELSTLNRIAIAVNALMSMDTIASTIVDQCVRHLQAEQGAVFLLEKEDRAEMAKTFVRHTAEFDDLPIHLNLSLSGWMIKNRRPVIINDPGEDHPLTRLDLPSMGIRSMLAAPLLTRDKMIGVLAIFNRRDEGKFGPEHARFLGIVGSQCAQVIERARLYEEEQRLESIRKDLAVARSIQHALLPDVDKLPDTDLVFGCNTPAREVGGDYFDIIQIDDTRTFLAIGDVSGKGVPASLLMSNALAVQRSHLSDPGSFSLVRMAENLNALLFHHTDPSQYITSLFGVLDRSNRQFEFVCAGHHYPVVVSEGFSMPSLPPASIVLGVFPDAEYSTATIQLPEGALMMVYTDGVTEAFNADGEEYGSARLENLLTSLQPWSARSACEAVVDDLATFRGKAEQSDDITMLAARV